MKKISLILLFVTMIVVLSGCVEQKKKKPVIYIYPEEEMEVSMKLDYDGELTYTYPKYENGWNVIAKPDGTLYSEKNDREYYCLFWEGKSKVKFDMEKGFVVAGNETEAFLEEALATLGLTEKEANEFIIYWAPQMENNNYNLITFQDEVYAESAKLEVTPKPDTLIRVFMAWQGLDKKIEIELQELKTVTREGFTVVEWGGAEVK